MNDIAREPVLGGAPAPAAPQPLRVRFCGSGSEYFRIWIVNLLLTIVTLGIYSAWAKVRTLQYFYRNTQLGGASFDYHGSPTAILKGRAIIFVLALAFNLSGQVSPVLTLLLLAAIGLVFPWLLVRSLRFRMANSSYRGLRFAFTGKDAQAYKVFLLWPVLTAFTFNLLAPFAHQRFKQYQHRNTRFGTTSFDFSATAGQFYGVYLRTFGMAILAVMAVGVVVVLAGVSAAAGAASGGRAIAVSLMVLAMYAAMLFLGPYFLARLQNVVWNHTTLGAHRFQSQVSAGKLFWIFISNAALLIVTLGLFTPFARVRSARYKLESVTMLAAGSLDTFVAGESTRVGALGDAAVDWYDIDIAL
ncbi:YjgN family protein [Ralstonia pseudosolanacearum]|uniref:YjgN family protein n=1 Tax=Ralstonia pseudosolanacearum TaxID=1310165 RepID=UPI000B3B0DF2|nr:YjgN family protein [Ralstonia pseudosolanacearum]MDO3623849.1 YjgN family protein [Ralstonia pseudosolanacearum]